MIRLVVALQAEARPLIRRFGLSADGGASGFRVYRSRDCALIISGMGQIAAAAATAYLHAFLEQSGERPWVNVGVAGHPRLPLGTPVLAHKVSTDCFPGRWYPGMAVGWSGETAEVRTVPSPVTGYEGDLLFDMEAAGYYPTACRFSSTELVHCLKIVSDNAASPVGEVTRERVVDLIEAAIPSLESLLESLSRLDEVVRVTQEAPSGYDEAMQRWHFTVSEGHRLRRALRRFRTATGSAPQWPRKLAHASGGEVLHWLESTLSALPSSLIDSRLGSVRDAGGDGT